MNQQQTLKAFYAEHSPDWYYQTACIDAVLGNCSGDTIFAPDPFAEEIHGDMTNVWKCQYHRYESALEI